MKTFKPRFSSVLVAVLASYVAVACGGKDGSAVNGGPGSGGPGSGADQPNLGDDPGAPDVGGLTGKHDGGTQDLTADQVDDITNAACTGWAGEGENLPAVLQLVVDVSQSMDEDAPGARNQSKWDVTREALRDALGALPGSAAAGVLYYPNQSVQLSTRPRDVDACVNVDALVPIDVLGAANSMQRRDIDQSLDDADTNGYTPTHDAYKFALEESLQPYETPANKFMLLITDGSPTMALQCIGESSGGGRGGGVQDAPTQPIIDAVKAASDAGIRTFVIGSPGSEESSSGMGGDKRPWLSEAAQVGGTAAPGCNNDGPNFCHLDMTQSADFAQALVEGLGTVVGQIIDQCTFAFPEPPPGQSIDANKTTVIVQTATGSTLVLPDNHGV
jgi:hypothetical protein